MVDIQEPIAEFKEHVQARSDANPTDGPMRTGARVNVNPEEMDEMDLLIYSDSGDEFGAADDQTGRLSKRIDELKNTLSALAEGKFADDVVCFYTTFVDVIYIASLDVDSLQRIRTRS